MVILPGGCTDCGEPIDEVALPRHPSHDLTEVEHETARRNDVIAAARRRAADRPRSSKPRRRRYAR